MKKKYCFLLLILFLSFSFVCPAKAATLVKKTVAKPTVAAKQKIDLDKEAFLITKSGQSLNGLSDLLKYDGAKRDNKKMTEMLKIYDNIFKKFPIMTIKEKYSVNNFLVYGTPSTVKILTDGRKIMLENFLTSEKTMPTKQSDWRKVLGLSSKKIVDNKKIATSSILIKNKLKPYQVAFIGPVNNVKVPLNGLVELNLQAGEKIKKIKLSFMTYNLISSNNMADVEVPVKDGYATYTLNVRSTTLVPIFISAEGESGDPVKDSEEEFKADTAGEMYDVFRTLQLFTDKKIETFLLEDDNYVMNYLAVSEIKRIPNFMVSLPGSGLLAIPTSDIEFKVDVPGILQINKDSVNTVNVKGLKDGETKITATYKGLSREIYYSVGSGNK